MKHYFLLLAALTPITLFAQNNPIFYGGPGDGVSSNSYKQTTLSRNNGGSGDGQSSEGRKQSVINSNVGGQGDGWHRTDYQQLTLARNSGGGSDGWSYSSYVQTFTSNFKGGSGDGWHINVKPAFLSAFNKGGNGDGWTGTYNPLSPLPLDFLRFDALKNGNSVRLEWEVANDDDMEKYDVERSEDAVRFQWIGSKLQSASAHKKYSLDDLKPLEGYNYYRLKVRKLNGSYSYTGVRFVVFRQQQDATVNIYPNPATDQVFVALAFEVKDEIVANVYDVNGKLMLHKQFTPCNTIQLDTRTLTPGNYYIQLYHSGQSITGKFLISK